MTRRTESRSLKLDLDEHTVTLAAEALRGEADRRRRVGLQLSSELIAAKRDEGTDIRSGALQVVSVLAEADSLAAAAEQLADAWAAGNPPRRGRRRPPAPSDPSAVATGDTSPGDDDDGHDDDDDDDDDDLAGLADLDAIRHLTDGSTVVGHDGDPDVAAARALLNPPVPDPAVAPAAAPTIPAP